MQSLLQRLFFEHFNTTSFVLESEGELHAFLIGFLSQAHPDIAYIHFVGVSPKYRGTGVGRRLYERFFLKVAEHGCQEVRCITSPINSGSIAFHRKLGFELMDGTGLIDGIPVVLDHAGPGQHRVCFRKRL